MTDTFEFKSIADMAYSIAAESVGNCLDGKKYTAAKVSEWIESIGGECLSRLRATSPNFKYIVNIAISQRVGAGLHMETCAFWDNKTDGSVTVRFENETMICICSVLGLAI